jgi:hypothetical protein
MRAFVVLLASAGLLAAQPASIPSAERNKLSALLPAPPGFSGRADLPAKFYSSDLATYLKAPQPYLDYRLVAMVHRTFKVNSVELTADIYDMGDPLMAYGIYSFEGTPEDATISMGSEGRVDIGKLSFFEGNYYVKLQATGEADSVLSVLDAAAKSIASHIGDPPPPVPQPAPWLPADGMVPHSQKYLVKSPMGHDCLAPALMAIYRFDDKDTAVLVSRWASDAEAATRLSMLKEHYAGKAALVEGLSGDVWRAGTDAFFVHGPVVVLLQAPPAGNAFLTKLYAAVR